MGISNSTRRRYSDTCTLMRASRPMTREDEEEEEEEEEEEGETRFLPRDHVHVLNPLLPRTPLPSDQT